MMMINSNDNKKKILAFVIFKCEIQNKLKSITINITDVFLTKKKFIVPSPSLLSSLNIIMNPQQKKSQQHCKNCTEKNIHTHTIIIIKYWQ